MRSPAVIVVLAATIALPAVPVAADQGVAVGLGRVAVDGPLRAGQRYRLPTLGVTTPRTEPGSYAVFVGAQNAHRGAGSLVSIPAEDLRSGSRGDPAGGVGTGAAAGRRARLLPAVDLGAAGGRCVGVGRWWGRRPPRYSRSRSSPRRCWRV